MEVGPVFYFVLLLIIGFSAYIVLQCLIIWIIRCCCPSPPATNGSRRHYRQNNSLELGRQQSRYGDIFFIEPNSPEAARIREQLEKDEKDLPSYDEVMRMCNLTTPTAAAALPTPPPPPIESTSIGIAALPAPPYTENDPHPNAVVIDANAVTPSPLESTPSTSRAAQIQIA
ncbi:uncharacterized protein LOC117785456 isoform X11 [Drosophila innubila]|uniref:uncharacterized protein LOC117785456 isoform X11 n=1 Tax=Drosophila innubila TaxID=198719 RepID=UPI00148E50B8|nr:uncharacterized protein LOC117785456 isoform X11 [Drosophila innubila]